MKSLAIVIENINTEIIVSASFRMTYNSRLTEKMSFKKLSGRKDLVSSAFDIQLRCVQRRTVQWGLPPVLGRGVPLLGPLPVSVAVVAVAPVRPPAQRDVDPDVQGAVACGGHTEHHQSETNHTRPGDCMDHDDQIIERRLFFGFTRQRGLNLCSVTPARLDSNPNWGLLKPWTSNSSCQAT